MKAEQNIQLILLRLEPKKRKNVQDVQEEDVQDLQLQFSFYLVLAQECQTVLFFKLKRNVKDIGITN